MLKRLRCIDDVGALSCLGAPSMHRFMPLADCCAGQITHKIVKVNSLFFLQVKTAFVKNVRFDTWVDALESGDDLVGYQ